MLRFEWNETATLGRKQGEGQITRENTALSKTILALGDEKGQGISGLITTRESLCEGSMKKDTGI